ncbi:MAG TPA: nuclear transport factor 2 family protein, partial [Saliniramus sp.]|nr:nuclear transport factor 2 family protein [Saliniramus sp.]
IAVCCYPAISSFHPFLRDNGSRMRRRLAIISLLALVAAGCRSVSVPSPQFGPGTESLLEAQGRFTAAITSRNQGEIDALLASEYSFHFIDHQMQGTMQPMPTVPRGKWAVKLLQETGAMPLQFTIVDARIHREVGVVASHYEWGGNRGGQSFSYEGYVTDIWIQRDGKWRLLVSYAQLLPPWM